MSLFKRALNVLRPNRLAREIEREMAFHVSECVDDLVGAGMRESDAACEARRRFGHQTTLKESTRDIDMLPWLESIIGDLRQGARVLRKSPGFAFVAVLSLGLGIGANTAIFSLINAVMIKSLPVSNAAALVTISSKSFGSEMTNPIWENLRDQQKVLAGIAAFSTNQFNLSDGGVVHRVAGSFVSGDYFNTLGVTPIAGRLLTRVDDTRGCVATAVVSYGFWQSELGGKQSAIGRSIALNNHPFTIIGVTPPEFFGVEIGQSKQIYAPLCAMAAIGRADMLDEKRGWFLNVVGTLEPGQTAARAQQELSLLTTSVFSTALTPDQYETVEKDPAKSAFQVKPGVGELSDLREQYSTALFALMVVVALVLFIGCANVANLLLARAAARQREIAVRFALGASRIRVVRQLLTETLLLATLGAVVGIFFARWSTGLVINLLNAGKNPVSLDVPIDARVLGFTIVVASVVALLFGLAPAWRSTRANPQEAMRANGRGIASGHSRFSISKALVVGQVSLSLVLVVGAGLLLGTFRTLATLDLGFKSENVLLVGAGFNDADDDASHTLPLQFQQQLRTIPGVVAVSASGDTPVSGSAWNSGIKTDGFASKKRGDAMVYLTEITGDYFSTMQTPVLLGRTFDNRDQLNGGKVAIIGQTAAKRFFPNANPIGKQFYMPSRQEDGPPYEVIGVVADSKYQSVREDPRSLVFLPVSQQKELMGSWNYEMRINASTKSVVSQVTALAKQMNPRITLEYRTLEEQVGASITRERLLATLSVFFGALALLLAMIGLYGTMSYSVQRRRNEIGVRLALGADRSRVFGLVLREVGVLLVAGLIIGTAGALGASRFVTSFLFGVQPTDTMTIVWSIATLAVVALLAGGVPAWRAARLDPMAALRGD
ncbi:MAG: ABC transporter permease [Gemmatimonadaceae bacterium]